MMEAMRGACADVTETRAEHAIRGGQDVRQPRDHQTLRDHTEVMASVTRGAHAMRKIADRDRHATFV